VGDESLAIAQADEPQSQNHTPNPNLKLEIAVLGNGLMRKTAGNEMRCYQSAIPPGAS
jgi:hypothetical protein